MKKYFYLLFLLCPLSKVNALTVGDLAVIGEIIGERMVISTITATRLGFPDGSSQTVAGFPSVTILDEGTLTGGVTWFNFIGAGVSASINGGTVTVTVSGGGSGSADNLGSHVSTRSLNMALFSILNSTGLEIERGSIMFGTGLPSALLHISTFGASIYPLVIISTGDNSSSRVFEINTASMSFSVSSISINGVEYIFPGSDGSDGQVLKTNGFGILTWQNDNTGGGGSGGDSLGVHQATKTLDMNGFYIANSTGLEVETGSIVFGTVSPQGLVSISSVGLSGYPLLVISTGSNRVFEVHSTSMAISFSSISIAGLTYVFPYTRGSNGQVLKENGAGVLTWQNDNSAAATVPGDSLGSHIATGTLVFQERFGIVGATSVEVNNGRVQIGTFPATSILTIATGNPTGVSFIKISTGGSSLDSHTVYDLTRDSFTIRVSTIWAFGKYMRIGSTLTYNIPVIIGEGTDAPFTNNGTQLLYVTNNGVSEIITRDSTNNTEAILSAQSSVISIGARTNSNTQFVSNNNAHLVLNNSGIVTGNGMHFTAARGGFSSGFSGTGSNGVINQAALSITGGSLAITGQHAGIVIATMSPILAIGTTHFYMHAGKSLVVGSSVSQGTAAFEIYGGSMNIKPSSTSAFGGGISVSTYAYNNGNAIFLSSFNARQYDGYSLVFGSGTVSAASTLTVRVPPWFTRIGIPTVAEYSSAGTAVTIRLNAIAANLTSFDVQNLDASNAKDFTFMVPAYTPSP